jgi:ATP-binding cassette, subfamily B, bacterial MsbA
MFRLLKLTLHERKYVALAFLATIFVALFSSTFVYLIQPIIDNMWMTPAQQAAQQQRMLNENPGKATARTRLLDILWRALGVDANGIKRVLPWVVLAVLFGKSLFTFLSSFFMKAVGNKIVKTLRDQLYEHILYQSTSFYDAATTGDLMSRLTNDIDRIQQAVGTAMSDLVEEAFVMTGILVVMLTIDLKLALMAFVLTPLAVLPMAAFSRQLKKQGRRSQIKMAEIYNHVYETISGHRIVKAFTTEPFELRKFLKASARYFRINLKLAWISSLSSPFMEFIGGLVGAFILVVGARRISAGYISAGDFAAFAMAIFSLFTPIKRLTRAQNVVVQATACLDRVEEIMRVPRQVQERPRSYPLPPVQGRVRFEAVRFSYQPDRPVLHDISFEVEPRQTVALVGFSGAGKTTIINLLARFYEPSAGRVLIDGIDIRDVTLPSLRSQIGLVTQDIVLFNDTVRANIAYGLEAVPAAKIEAAAIAAECHRFITELPQGYDTPIGERGGLLSVGQRQRLAIARALLKNPPILIMDEATSSLDSESERLIQKALARIMRDRTTFVIAHRLSTIRNADMILVIEKGRIVESGSHDQLLRKHGVYRMLYNLQYAQDEEIAP